MGVDRHHLDAVGGAERQHDRGPAPEAADLDDPPAGPRRRRPRRTGAAPGPRSASPRRRRARRAAAVAGRHSCRGGYRRPVMPARRRRRRRQDRRPRRRARASARVHLLSWRDLADVEAGGSEVHAAEVARLWAEAGLDVTLRTCYAQGQPAGHQRDGYKVVRRAGRYLVFPRAVLSRAAPALGPRDALVEYLERHAVPLTAVGAAAVDRRPAPRPRRDVEDGARRREPALATAGELARARASPRCSTAAAASSRCRDSSKADIVERARPPPRTHRRRPPRRRPPLHARRRRDAPRTRSWSPSAGSCRSSATTSSSKRCAERPAHDPDLELAIVGEGYERPASRRSCAASTPRAGSASPATSATHELVDLYRRAWLVAVGVGPRGLGHGRSPRRRPAARRRSPPASPGHLDAVARRRERPPRRRAPPPPSATRSADVLGDERAAQVARRRRRSRGPASSRGRPPPSASCAASPPRRRRRRRPR